MRRAVGLLAATLAVVLVAGPANGDPARPSHRSTVDSAAPVDITAKAPPRQDVTAQATVGLRVISHNICGGASCGNRGATGPLSSVTTLIDEFQPHLFMLQEVCWSQYQYLQAHAFSSGPYQMGFTVMIDNYTGCGVADCSVNEDEDPDNDNKQCWTGQLLAAKGTISHRDEIPLGGERHQVGNTGSPVNPPRKFNALCYDVALAGFARTVKGCSVHMRAFSDPAGESKRARTAQTARLASDLDGDIAAGKIVVVGGDFNSVPTDPAMNAFYRLDTNVENAWGLYYEADQDDKSYYNSAYCSQTAAACRSGAKTIGVSSKLDYIFYSETTDATSVSGLPIDEAMSDHWFYRGLANVRAS